MNLRETYPPGVPCWVDTTQPDPDTAVRFYEGLMGWRFEDVTPEGAPGRYLVARVDGVLTVAVVPVAGLLDLKALAAAVGGRKAGMADPADAERATGYVVGGISPLGQRRALPTVVDDSALEFGTVLVSAGRRGLQVELPPAELIRLTRARTAPIGRPGT